MSDPIEELRRVASSTPAPPEALSSYLARVRDRAFTITDADLAELKAHVGEDVIFEQTVAAAIGEGLRRLDRAREVIG